MGSFVFTKLQLKFKVTARHLWQVEFPDFPQFTILKAVNNLGQQLCIYMYVCIYKIVCIIVGTVDHFFLNPLLTREKKIKHLLNNKGFSPPTQLLFRFAYCFFGDLMPTS